MRNFLSDCDDLARNLDLDFQAIYEDAYAIFETNPTREGAEEAAKFYAGVVREACESVVSETLELIKTHQLNRHQRRTLRVEEKISVFAQNMDAALIDLEAAYVEAAVNGTMDTIAEAGQMFENMVQDILL